MDMRCHGGVSVVKEAATSTHALISRECRKFSPTIFSLVLVFTVIPGKQDLGVYRPREKFVLGQEPNLCPQVHYGRW